MKTIKLIRAATAAFVILIFTSGLYAQQEMPPKPDRPPMPPRQNFHQQRPPEKPFSPIPDLTEQQKEQIEELNIANMKTMLPLQNELHEKEAQLHTLSTSDNPSMNKINGLIDEIGTIKTKMMKQREDHRQKVRKLLNEKQRLFLDTNPPVRK